MKTLRKGIAGLLLLAMFLTNSLSVAAVSLTDSPPADESQELSLTLKDPNDPAPPAQDVPKLTVPQTETDDEEEPAQPEPEEQQVPQAQEPQNLTLTAPQADKTQQQNTTLNATVAPTASDYSVIIPERVNLGKLSPQQDFHQDYTVQVVMSASDGTERVTVKADYPSIQLHRQGGSGALECRNVFGAEGVNVFTASGSRSGTLSIAQAVIAAAAPGSYSGTLNFQITRETNLTPQPDVSPDVSPDLPDPTPDVSPEQPDVSPDLPTLQPPTPTGDPNVPPAPVEGHFTATISMRHEADINKASMCDGLFHRTAQIDVKDGMATMTVYVVDPVPAFPDLKKTVSNIRLHYNGKEYIATLDQSKKENKYFDLKPSFIDPAGSYPASPITVTLPYEALVQSVNGKLKCTAFVDAIMNTDVTFYVVLDGLPDAPPAPTVPPKPVTPPTPSPSNPPAPDNPLPPPPSGGGIGGGGNGSTYYTANVSMRHAQDFNKLSMCSKLFYPKADIVCTGDTATLTLYVIDPVPQFPEEGTPVKNVSLHYNGSNYSASVNSGSKVMKQFAAAAGFVGEAGTYSATPIKVQLPMQAIKDSVNKALTASCYVNAVMHTDVEFYVVLDGLTQVSGPSSNKPASGGGIGSGTATAAEETGDTITLTLGEGPGEKKVAQVSTRKITDFDAPSMSDNMFYDEAELLFKGDNVEVTMYIVDPVPGFEEEGTPLANPVISYNDEKYTTVLHPEKQVTKHFPPIPGFTEEAGDYTTTPITVVLPKEAIADSLEGKLTGSAFVNTVMKTDVEFYLVFDDVKTPAETAEEPEEEAEDLPAEAVPGGPVRIDTDLFPQILLYILLTAAALGCAAYIRWKKR